MYVLCQSRLGPGAYQVTSYASAAARMSCGYMVCARARVACGYMVCTRVAWLHGLRPCASCGYMVCARARVACGYMVCTCVAWLHGLRPCASRGYMVCAMDSDCRKELARLRQRRHTYHMSVPRSCENECCAIPRVAGSESFNVVAFLVIYILYLSVCQ